MRGVVGEDLTPQLVERLGRAATPGRGGGAVFIARDTRASGPELERAFASGVASAEGTPCWRVCCRHLPSRFSHSISARSSPPRTTRPSTTGQVLPQQWQQAHRRRRGGDRGAARRAAARPRAGADRRSRSRGRQLPRPRPRAIRAPIWPAFVSASTARTGPIRRLRRVRSRSSAPRCSAIGVDPDGIEHQRRLRRHRPARSAAARPRAAARSRRRLRRRRRPDARGGRRRRMPSTATKSSRSSPSTSGRPRRRHHDDEPRLPPADGGTGDSGRDDRRRRPLRARGAPARGRCCSAASSPGHIIYLDGHVTGDGLAAALLLCAIAPRAALSPSSPRAWSAIPQVEGERPRRAPRAE